MEHMNPNCIQMICDMKMEYEMKKDEVKKKYMLGLNNIQMMSLPSLYEDKRCCDQVKDSSQFNFIVRL